MNDGQKIVLKLMTEKGYEVLEEALAYKDLISFVVIGRDSTVHNDYSREIARSCEENSVSYYFRGDAPKIDPGSYVLAVSWRWMISHPEKKLIIFHDSILPKYRGFAPLINMLVNGETEIGVTAIFGASEYDRGDIIAQEKTTINYPIKIYDAIKINNSNYRKLISKIIKNIKFNELIISHKQIENEASYSIWRDLYDYYIDWSKGAEEIKRLVDAVGFPYLGARSKVYNDDDIIIEEAVTVEDVECVPRHVGKVIFVDNGFPVVVCGQGLLKITKAKYDKGDTDTGFLPLKKHRTRFI